LTDLGIGIIQKSSMAEGSSARKIGEEIRKLEETPRVQWKDGSARTKGEEICKLEENTQEFNGRISKKKRRGIL